MSKFWQYLQSQLQPVVAMESTLDPGQKCRSGFFSIGSTWLAIILPYTRSISLPPTFARTPHSPTWPSFSLQ
jgi:hypothetical protein